MADPLFPIALGLVGFGLAAFALWRVWAYRIGYTGLVLLVILAGPIILDLVLDMFEP